MKLKAICITALIGMTSMSYAAKIFDLTDPHPKVMFSCGKYQITKDSTKQEITSKCKVLKYKLKEGFFMDKEELTIKTAAGDVFKCKVTNDKLKSCQLQNEENL